MANLSNEFLAELTEIRHYIHQHPELSSEEYQTTAFIKEKLTGWGIDVIDTPLKTGVIAEIGNKSKGKTIALRADIDALPILEKTGLDFASENLGVMHACGHDFHQTSLLGAAKILKDNEEHLNGRIRLIFQPAEENHRGAREVVAAGYLNDIQAIIGYHNHPGLKPGEIGLKSGGIMAAVDHFKVDIIGRGTHAANPQLGVDVLVITSQIVVQLQSIVARNIAPQDSVVVSVTHIKGGNTWNVLPDTSFFEGTIRSFSNEDRRYAKARFAEIINHTAAAYGATAKITWLDGPPVTDNDSTLTPLVFENSKQFAKVFTPISSNAGEDFADYQQVTPGVFAFIGSNGDADAAGWHHSDFLVKDEGLATAVNYYVENSYLLLKYFNDGEKL
ncbi:MAG: amidohydrolase [Streptococcaceae bacterium]|nr:amidohydrolase [Streptococcaceae bacterium]